MSIRVEADREARIDLLNFLEIAQPSVESLEKLKGDIMAGTICPRHYWYTEGNCGCFKGTLFLHEMGKTPSEYLDENAEEGETPEEVFPNGFVAMVNLLSRTFNYAPVDPDTAFEEWLIQYYDESEEDKQVVCDWIDEYIEKYQEDNDE